MNGRDDNNDLELGGGSDPGDGRSDPGGEPSGSSSLFGGSEGGSDPGSGGTSRGDSTDRPASGTTSTTPSAGAEDTQPGNPDSSNAVKPDTGGSSRKPRGSRNNSRGNKSGDASETDNETSPEPLVLEKPLDATFSFEEKAKPKPRAAASTKFTDDEVTTWLQMGFWGIGLLRPAHLRPAWNMEESDVAPLVKPAVSTINELPPHWLKTLKKGSAPAMLAVGLMAVVSLANDREKMIINEIYRQNTMGGVQNSNLGTAGTSKPSQGTNPPGGSGNAQADAWNFGDAVRPTGVDPTNFPTE